MNNQKDYYAILGILPSAEDVVIRAAYKALAQRYHPDRNKENLDEANRRMTEINEAFTVLSNKEKRKEYDQVRGSGVQSGGEYFKDPEEYEFNHNDPLYYDWETAIEYYPELRDIEKRLRKVSWRLAYSFKAYLLEMKLFEQRDEIARQLERQFLQTYFGDNKAVISFARHLINKGNKEAARKLNQAVRVLGTNIDANRIILKLQKDFVSVDDKVVDAVKHGNLEDLHELLKAGADPNSVDEEGMSLISIAKRRDDDLMASVLKHYGAIE